MIDARFQNLLDKLQVNDLLSLALNHIPKNYINTTLLDSLPRELVFSGVVKAKILECSPIGFGKNARLNIKAQMLDSSLYISIFHYKPFHKAIFAKNSELYIMGKFENKGNYYATTQPKVIKEINKIKLEFKTKLLKQNSMQELVQNLLTQENLDLLNLPKDVAKHIAEIFNPSIEFVIQYQKNKAFSKTHLDAIKFLELFAYMQKMSKKKRDFLPNYICESSQNLDNFISSLPFALTKGQTNAINDILKDVSQNRAARRLIMGDVGCGKTIVILAAVMMIYPKKSILMAPTTILAKQLYSEAKKFLPSFVSVALVSKDAKKDEFMQDSHFIIGTQALLYRDLELNNEVGLVMSDEQHRFGTMQRHKLEQISAITCDISDVIKDSINEDSSLESKDLDLTLDGLDSKQDIESKPLENLKDKQNSKQNLKTLSTLQDSRLSQTQNTKKRPHTLQFSATPIPRTLAMINDGLIDFSFIKDLPFKKDIDTMIIHKAQFSQLLTHLKTEIAQSRQAIIVYPLVEESSTSEYLSLKQGATFWQKHFQGVFVTSGKDKLKTQVIDEFAKCGSILLATTVIEVGISLPKVSTIVIVAPEKLGLATLHQLRGRVSRNGLKGYCFLYTNQQNTSKLEAFAKTNNGFDIAELDLSYRNSGDLLSGQTQSGAQFKYFDYSDVDIVAKVKKCF